ncbi:hypothetical protein [Streptomyces chilikensis]|uniref:hypothetical protein n=1 Tax=Streptomyces chilikensis TaxID=1194079 RepID=UPI0014089945|nr:hypothetical protein [Streptomyces chilikensis]
MTQSGHGGPWTPDRPDQPPYPQQRSEESWNGAGTEGGAWGSSAPQVWTGAPGPGPLPPESPAPGGHGDAEATQYLPPVPPAQSVPSPPPALAGHAADDEATRFLRPIPAADDSAATQYLPPVPAADDSAATQYLPPVAPLPAGGHQQPRPQSYAQPQQGMDRDTQMLRRIPAAEPRRTGGDAEATQYLPPVPGAPAADDGRQPPAEFDNLFRSDAPRPAYGQPAAGGYDPRPAPAASGRRGSGSRIPLLAAAGVGIVVLGIGIGSLMAGGEETPSSPVAAGSPSAPPSGDGKPQEEKEDGEDAVKAQAVALDQLLADSGDSRSAVVGAVEDVRKCEKLEAAAQALRGAAQQRADLVTRLNELEVDRLPDHAELTAALTKAWQASKSADEHYAAWADQVAAERGKLCRRGQARHTAETRAATEQSGTATAEKEKASGLWNRIAKEWKLTERAPIQL